MRVNTVHLFRDLWLDVMFVENDTHLFTSFYTAPPFPEKDINLVCFPQKMEGAQMHIKILNP